jgi:hypothetical protein
VGLVVLRPGDHRHEVELGDDVPVPPRAHQHGPLGRHPIDAVEGVVGPVRRVEVVQLRDEGLAGGQERRAVADGG